MITKLISIYAIFVLRGHVVTGQATRDPNWFIRDDFAFSDASRQYDLNQAFNYFKKFCASFNKFYDSPKDFDDAFVVFKENLRLVNRLNKIYKEAEFRINEFTDLSLENFTANYTGLLNPSPMQRYPYINYWPHILNRENYDFRNEFRVSEYVRHQRNCSNSYIYAAIAVLEGQVWYHNYQDYIQNRLKYAFSDEQVFECDPQYTCKTKSTPIHVYESVKAQEGVMPLFKYHSTNHGGTSYYPAVKPQCTLTNTSDFIAHMTAYYNWKFDEEITLVHTLGYYGPMATSMYVSETIKNYHSGILDPLDCDNVTNQNVVLVGSGRDKNTPYWIIRNSWGPRWGEDGYIRLARNKPWICRVGKENLSTCKIDFQKSSYTTTSTRRPRSPLRPPLPD